MSLIVGRTLGDFVVREPLASGGMGLVYKAEQVTLGREAVIKILRDEKSAGGCGSCWSRACGPVISSRSFISRGDWRPGDTRFI